MNDFYELRLDTKKWQPVQALGPAPGQRFCHVALVHGDSMFGACVRANSSMPACVPPPPT